MFINNYELFFISKIRINCFQLLYLMCLLNLTNQ